MHESMRDRLRRMKAGALPVERNSSRSLRTIVAEMITKCCVARQCAKLVTSESSRHAKEWELRRKLRAYIRSQQYAWDDGERACKGGVRGAAHGCDIRVTLHRPSLHDFQRHLKCTDSHQIL